VWTGEKGIRFRWVGKRRGTCTQAAKEKGDGATRLPKEKTGEGVKREETGTKITRRRPKKQCTLVPKIDAKSPVGTKA